MKLLLFSQYFWPENFPINNLAHTLSEHGVELSVMTGKPNYPAGKVFPGYQAAGVQRHTWGRIPITRLPMAPRGTKGAIGLILNYVTFVLSGLVFGPMALRRRKFDAILVYAPSPIFQAIPALFIGWIKKAPVVIWVQDLWPDSLVATGYVKNRLVLRAIEAVVRFIYRRADLLLVQSLAFEEPVGRLAAITPVAYFPNPVDRVFSAPVSTAMPDLPALERGFVVMFAGNVGSAQGVDIIVEAASLLRQYSDIRFVVLGYGSRWEWMRDEVIRRGLQNVELPGSYPLEMMPALMGKASALLVCLANRDIFAATIPSKIQAYLGVGRPILAALNGEGARVVLEAGAGLAVPAEDAAGLAAAVLDLYRMPTQLREAMGARGRRYCKENFDQNMLAERLMRHIELAARRRKEGM